MADGRSQLWRQCGRIPLGLLDGADVVNAHVARRRSAEAIVAGRGAWALLLLALSAMAASYPTWNAWTPPWIMNFLGYMGWL